MKKLLLTVLFSYSIMVIHAQTWIVYSKNDSKLPSNHVQAILCDEENRMWMATDSGLVRKNEDQWITYTTNHMLPDNTINSIFLEKSTAETKIWLSTKKGACFVIPMNDNSVKVTTFSKANSGLGSDSVWLVSVDNKSAKWFAHKDGISGFNDNEWYLQTSSNNESILTNVSSIASFSDGWNLFCTRGTGVARLKMEVDGVSGASSYVSNYTGLWSDNVLCTYIDSIGNQWFGTDKGTSYHVGFKTREGWDEPALRRSTHQISDTVYAIKEDRSGRIWMATPAGVVVYTNQTLFTFTVADGLPDNPINDIAFDKDGNVWIATNKGIAKAGIEGLLTVGNSIMSVVNRGGIEKVYPTITSYVTNINFTVSSYSKQIVLQVYNLNGQLIQTLFKGSLPEGSYTKSWNCDDNCGSKVKQGMYLIVFRTEEGADVRKIIVSY